MHEHKLVGLPTQRTNVLLVEKRASKAVSVILVAIALPTTCCIDDMVSNNAWIAYTPAVVIVHHPHHRDVKTKYYDIDMNRITAI